MWISGLEGLTFTAFADGTGTNLRLYTFDKEARGFVEVTTDTGNSFRPYGAAASVFGDVFASGRAGGAEGEALGTEIYRLNEDGTVSLFSDILPGTDSSFVDFEDSFTIGPTTTSIIHGVGVFPQQPYVIYDTGASAPLSDFFSSINSFSNLRSTLAIGAETYFLALPNGTNSTQAFRVDPMTQSYTVLADFSEAVGSYTFQSLTQVGDEIFASVLTSAHGRELWRLDASDQWELVEDFAPGPAYGSPSFKFEFEGVKYFTAVNNALGRELYTLTLNGFALAIDTAPGPTNGANSVRHFEYDDKLYFTAVGGLRQIEPGGVISTVSEFIPGLTDKFPQAIINFDTGEVTRSLGGDTTYAIRNGVLTELSVPAGSVDIQGFYDDNLVIEVSDPNGGVFTLYSLTEDDTWAPIFTSADMHYNERLTRVSQITDPARSRDVYFGDNDDEIIAARSGGSIIYAEGGNDRITGSSAADIIIAGLGDDIINGGAGGDDLDGGIGRDTVSYVSASSGVRADLLDASVNTGDANQDSYTSIENLSGSSFGDNLRGDHAANSIGGRDGDDRLFGRGGDDILRGDSGADVLSGGSGSDYAVYANSDAAVTVNLTAGTGRGGHAEGDTLIGIEKLSGSSGFGDRLTGDDQGNTLRGNGGDDILRGEAGADILNGGSGSDWAFYLTSDAAVTVDLSSKTGKGGDAEGDTLIGIEKLFGSSDFGDRLTGDDQANTLRGDGGDDILRGEAGADVLNGGSGSDWAFYSTSDAAVTVDLAMRVGTGGHAEGDILIGIEKLFGSSGFGDKLTGDDQANTLRGSGGDDILRGEAGADVLNGGSGSDWAFYSTSDAAVTVDLTTRTGTGGDAEGDILIGIEKLFGSSNFGDKLTGDDQANTLRGGGGDDTLNGAQGNDVLRGGSGDDTFVFDTDWGNDTVFDFNVAGGEVLDFSSIGIDLADLTIDYGASNTTITYDGNQIGLIGSTAVLQNEDFLF